MADTFENPVTREPTITILFFIGLELLFLLHHKWRQSMGANIYISSGFILFLLFFMSLCLVAYGSSILAEHEDGDKCDWYTFAIFMLIFGIPSILTFFPMYLSLNISNSTM